MNTPPSSGKPFIAAQAEPVQVNIPGELHPSGAATWVPYADLTIEVYEKGGRGLTFEGVTFS
jgi:hypothetical protein